MGLPSQVTDVTKLLCLLKVKLVFFIQFHLMWGNSSEFCQQALYQIQFLIFQRLSLCVNECIGISTGGDNRLH